MVYKQKTSKKWWYKFLWNGELIRESTKQTNKRVAEQMEATHKASQAKGEVGIRDRVPVPTLKDFCDREFFHFVRATSAAKPRTVTFYETTTGNLKTHAPLADLPLNEITAEGITNFVKKRQDAGMQVSTINRDLATLRRMFHLAQEWEKVATVLPRVLHLDGA